MLLNWGSLRAVALNLQASSHSGIPVSNSLELSITHSHQVVIPPDENSVSEILAPSRPKRSIRGIHKKDLKKKLCIVLIPLILLCFCKKILFFSLFKRLLEFVNSTMNVCSKMIGCFEVVPLSPAPTVIQVRPTRDLSLLFDCFQNSSTRHCLVRSFCM